MKLIRNPREVALMRLALPIVPANGGGGGNTTSNTVATPWTGQQPYLSNVFQGAQNTYDQYAANPASSVAGFTPMQGQAMGITQNVANGTNFGYAPTLNNAAGGYTTNLLGGAYLNANPANGQLNWLGGNNTGATALTRLSDNGSGTAALSGMSNNGTGTASLSNFAAGGMLNNPYESGAVNAANDAITRAYQTATAPQTASAFEGSGRFGSGAYNQAVSQNQQDLATQLGNTDAGLLANLYQQNMGNMLSAAGTQAGQQLSAAGTQAGQQLSAAGTQAGQQLGALGTLGQNYNTAAQQQLAGSLNAPNLVNSINGAATNLYNMGGNQQALEQSQINAPWQLLNNYSNLIQGQYGGNTSTTTPYYQNQLAGGLGGAASGAAMGSMFGPWGTAIGAVGGGLLGAFSDRRLKADICATGKRLPNGLPLYRFRYVWEEPDVEHIGVMVDEARKVAPHAVFRDISGFDKVNYAALGGEHVFFH
jgi:hypothetical protein